MHLQNKNLEINGDSRTAAETGRPTEQLPSKNHNYFFILTQIRWFKSLNHTPRTLVSGKNIIKMQIQTYQPRNIKNRRYIRGVVLQQFLLSSCSSYTIRIFLLNLTILNLWQRSIKFSNHIYILYSTNRNIPRVSNTTSNSNIDTFKSHVYLSAINSTRHQAYKILIS